MWLGQFAIGGRIRAGNGDVRQVLASGRDGGEYRDAFGTDRQAQRGILDVAAREELPVRQYRGPHSEMRVGAVCKCSGPLAAAINSLSVMFRLSRFISWSTACLPGGNAVKDFPEDQGFLKTTQYSCWMGTSSMRPYVLALDEQLCWALMMTERSWPSSPSMANTSRTMGM